MSLIVHPLSATPEYADPIKFRVKGRVPSSLGYGEIMNNPIRRVREDLKRESGTPLFQQGTGGQESLENLIDDTIRMIENTQEFLNRLDRSQPGARQYLEKTSLRLESSLASLRERRETLGRSEGPPGFC